MNFPAVLRHYFRSPWRKTVNDSRRTLSRRLFYLKSIGHPTDGTVLLLYDAAWGLNLKITFIKPNIGRREHSLYVDHGRMEPLMLAVLAGMTPPDVDVAMYDDRMEAIPYDEATDLVAISVESYTARRSYEIADEFRQRGVQVILGGMHPTLIPDEAALHADSIFLGDAENSRKSITGRQASVSWVENYRDATCFAARAICRLRCCSIREAVASPVISAL
jgi:hypothetical protein